MSHLYDEVPFYINEQINGVDESIPEFKFYYKDGQLSCYLFKGIFYTGTWPEYWAKFQYNSGVLFGTGPAHCRRCIINGSKRGVMVGPCVKCAPQYDYELGSGFERFGKEATLIIDGKLVPSVNDLHMKYVDLSTIGRPIEPILLDESLELACNELRDKLFKIHGSTVDEREAIEGLMRFIKSFNNPREIREKIDSALLIPDSKMYNQNWAGTDWDWFTGQLNKDELYAYLFTEEECESIRISQERVRELVEFGSRAIIYGGNVEE